MQPKRRWGRFPKLPKEVQELILEAEKAKEEEKKEKLKELKKQLKKEASICGAVQGNGRVCLRKPISENGRCHMHGGDSKGQITPEGRERALANLNPKAGLIHGVYSKDFKSQLTKEEVDLYNYIVEWFFDNYEVDPINLALLDRFIMNQIKTARLDSADFLRDSRDYNDVEIKMIRFAETLGLNRKFKESKENKDNADIIDIANLLSFDDHESK